MQLVVAIEGSDQCKIIELPDDADLEILVQMIQADYQLILSNQVLFNEGTNQPINYASNNRSVKLMNLGIYDGTSLSIRPSSTSISPNTQWPTAGSSSIASPYRSAPFSSPIVPSNHSLPPVKQHWFQYSIDELLLHAAEGTQLFHAFEYSGMKELVQAIRVKDRKALGTIILKANMQLYNAEKEDADLMNADPMDVEAQKKIAAKIHLQRVQENYDSAMENLPESFGSVSMLYVNMFVNNQAIAAFVDSGAQISLMSLKCAEKCGLSYLIDTRMKQTLKGVGSAETVGRIHAAQMKFGKSFIAVCLTVVADDGMEFLFGLDNIKRLRGVIDLHDNVLRLDGANGKEEMPFLSEYDMQQYKTANNASSQQQQQDEEGEKGVDGKQSSMS